MLTLLRDVSIVPGERRKTTAFEDSDRATRPGSPKRQPRPPRGGEYFFDDDIFMN